MFISLFLLRLTLYSFSTPHLYPFPRDNDDLRDLYYPIRVRLDGSLSVLECTVSNQSIMTCFCSDCQGIIYFSFCGKYYRSSTICKRLSTIRLMNAVSWRACFVHVGFHPYSPASRIQSFCFYIPHERLRLGGHISFQSSASITVSPHPWIPGVCQQRLQNRTARTSRITVCDVVTVRLCGRFPPDHRLINVIFIPSYTQLECLRL